MATKPHQNTDDADDDFEDDDLVAADDDTSDDEDTSSDEDAGAEEDAPASDEEASASDEDTSEDPDREALRARRREERRQKKVKAREEFNRIQRELSAEKRRNDELEARMRRQEQRGVSADVAQVDRAIQAAEAARDHAKRIIADATARGDGTAVVEAQEQFYEARQALEELGRIKEHVHRATKVPPQPKMDPMVQNQVADWQKRHAWYDVRGRDTDSRIVLSLDNEISAEGFDPRSPEYWDELENRCKKYLPHRFRSGNNTGGQQRTDGRTKPRTVVQGRGNGGGAAGDGGFKLSKERVEALKEAGIWDDPERRKKAISKYREYDRQNQR